MYTVTVFFAYQTTRRRILNFGPASYVLLSEFKLYANLPEGLEDALTGRQKSLPKVENVNLGRFGEWFVRFRDGSMSCGNLDSNCEETVNHVKKKGERIHEILFGRGRTWMIRFYE